VSDGIYREAGLRHDLNAACRRIQSELRGETYPAHASVARTSGGIAVDREKREIAALGNLAYCSWLNNATATLFLPLK
jgi:hypothetical protein